MNLYLIKKSVEWYLCESEREYFTIVADHQFVTFNRVATMFVIPIPAQTTLGQPVIQNVTRLFCAWHGPFTLFKPYDGTVLLDESDNLYEAFYQLMAQTNDAREKYMRGRITKQ